MGGQNRQKSNFFHIQAFSNFKHLCQILTCFAHSSSYLFQPFLSNSIMFLKYKNIFQIQNPNTLQIQPSFKFNHLSNSTIFRIQSSVEFSHVSNSTIFRIQQSFKFNHLSNSTVFGRLFKVFSVAMIKRYSV